MALTALKIARDYPTALHLQKKLDPKTKTTPALKLIANQLKNTINTPAGRLIISIPPQEGKTQLTRHEIVRQLAINPSSRIVYASHTMSLARKHGRTIRNLIQQNPWLGIQPARKNRAANDWQLENMPGGVISVGIGTGLTGNPADIAIIDDPITDRQQADSPTQRETIWEWWTDVLSTRLAPDAPVILIMTRWHEDDMAGRLLKQTHGDKWQYLNIPAIAGANDPLGREPGQPLRSARGTRNWETIKQNVGSRTWQALYQGNPTPQTGNIFNPNLWRYWTQQPWQTDTNGANWLPGGQVIQSWDLTFTGGNNSDYVAGQIWWLNGSNAWLLHQYRGQWTFTQTINQIKQATMQWPQTMTKLVENKANGPAVINQLQNSIPGLTPVNPNGNKVSRANAILPLVEAGNIMIPAAAPWLEDFKTETTSFPASTHDDQVDAMTQALNYLYIDAARRQQGTLNNYDLG